MDESGDDRIAVDNLRCQEYDPLDENANPFPKGEQRKLKGRVKYDTGAGVHTAPADTFVSTHGTISIQTVTGSDERQLGISDVFPNGQREACEADRALWAPYVAVKTGDQKGFYWFPKGEDVPERFVAGPPVIVDGDSQAYACYLDDGQMMMPDNLDLAKQLTAKMPTAATAQKVGAKRGASGRRTGVIDSVRGYASNLPSVPEDGPVGEVQLESEEPFEEWAHAETEERSALQLRWDQESEEYDAEAYGPEGGEETILPLGCRLWEDEDPTGAFTDAIKKAIRMAIGRAPQVVWFADQYGGRDANVPRVIIPYERAGECYDLAVVFTAEGRPVVNHIREVRSHKPFADFPHQECELFVRTFGRTPEEEDRHEQRGARTRSTRDVARQVRFVDSFSFEVPAGSEAGVANSTAAQDGSNPDTLAGPRNFELYERCDDCGANNCPLVVCFTRGCRKLVCLECVHPLGDADDNGICRTCYRDVFGGDKCKVWTVDNTRVTKAQLKRAPAETSRERNLRLTEEWAKEMQERLKKRTLFPRDLILVGGNQRVDRVEVKDPRKRLVRDLALDVMSMQDDIDKQVVRLQKNAGESVAKVDDLVTVRRNNWDKFCRESLEVAANSSEADKLKAVRKYVHGEVSKGKNKDADRILRGGDAEETTAAQMQRTKQTGKIDRTSYDVGHWHADAVPLVDAPTYTQQDKTGVAIFVEPRTHCIFVRPTPDATGDSVFEQLAKCRALNGEVKVLSGDSASIFKHCDDLFVAHGVTEQAISPEKQNQNKAEEGWKKVLGKMRGRMNAQPQPPKRSWPWCMRWAEAVLNIASGAWAVKFGILSWRHAIQNLLEYGEAVLVYHTAGQRNASTFGARGRLCAFVRPSHCGGIEYTEWKYIVGGGKRLAEVRVTANWRRPERKRSYFEGFSKKEHQFIVQESEKELPRRKRGKPAAVKKRDVYEVKKAEEPESNSGAPEADTNAGASQEESDTNSGAHSAPMSKGQKKKAAKAKAKLHRGFDQDAEYKGIFAEQVQPIHPKDWDETIESMMNPVAPTAQDDYVVLNGRPVQMSEVIRFQAPDESAVHLDVVQNLGMKQALGSKSWFDTGLTHEQVFRPAVRDEWNNSFETTGSFVWRSVAPVQVWRDRAKKDKKKYPNGLIDLNLHFLAGVKGFEHGAAGLAVKHGGVKVDQKSPLFQLQGKTKPKVRAVINTEIDIITGQVRDGRLPGEIFESRIPAASTTLTALYVSALTQKAMLVIDESSAYPSVEAGGVPAVCRLPDFAWEFAMEDHPWLRAEVEYWLKQGYKLSDLRVEAPKANYGRQRAGFVYEEAAAKAKREIGFVHGGVRGLHLFYSPQDGIFKGRSIMELVLSGEKYTVTGPGPRPIGGQYVSSYVDDDTWGVFDPKLIERLHAQRKQQPRTIEDVFKGASQLGTQLLAIRFTEAELGIDNRQRCRDNAKKRGIEIDESNVLEPELETVTLLTRSQEPLKNKLVSEFETLYKVELEVQSHPVPVGYNVSCKGTPEKPGRFAETAPKWLGMSGYVAMHTHASDPLQYGQCCLGSVTTRWSERDDAALLHFLGYIKGVKDLKSWSIWASRDQRLGLVWAQLVSDASHGGHQDLTSHAGCDFFLCGPCSRGHVEGHSSRLKRQFGASSEVEAAGLMQCAKRSAPFLDAADSLLEQTTPVEVLLDAQVVIRQVSFGADGKILASLRRFHGLDLGQLHLWGQRNSIRYGWWRGDSEGFTTDPKTKSQPKDHVDDPRSNRFFLLRSFSGQELGELVEREELTTGP